QLQVALILAWALTIHKSQGQSLPWVVANLMGAWLLSQVYAALSRAISLMGLCVV
ncbi:hypothetical protein CALCODRAFT_404210, partial [Calocera cornea HHB12733]